MAVLVDINSTDLLRFIKNLEKAPLDIQKSASQALNRVGDEIVNDVVDEISSETGIETDVIRRSLVITKSDPDTLMYRINASASLLDETAKRPMRGRRAFAKRSDNYFHADEMVEVVTMEDDKVCALCQKVHDEGPYKISEARLKIPVHPHCRCLLQPTRPKRQQTVRFRKARAAQTSDRVRAKLRSELKKEIEKALDKALHKNLR